MAANKITATFGADVSEVEAKMIQATRATKAYERAVKGIDDAEKRAAANRAENMSSLGKGLGEITKKFSGGKLMESLASGLGIGSAMQIAEKAAGLIAGYWERAAKHAEAIAKFSDRTTDAILKQIGLRRTDDQTLALDKQKLGMLELIALQAELKAGSEWATDADKQKAAEARANAEEARLSILEREKKKREEIAEKTKRTAEERKQLDKEANQLLMEMNKVIDERGTIEAQVRNLKKEMLDLSLTDIERAKVRNELLSAELELSRLNKKEDLEGAQAKAKADEDAARKKAQADEREQKALQELDQLEYDRKWRFATDEQRLAQIRKEGREAQARLDKEYNADNLLALEKLRKKYLDFIDELKKTKKELAGREKLSKELDDAGLTRGEDGKLRRGRVVVSDTDAARTISTQRRNAEFTAQARRQQITPAGRVGGSNGADTKESQLLAQIRDLLKPRAL